MSGTAKFGAGSNVVFGTGRWGRASRLRQPLVGRGGGPAGPRGILAAVLRWMRRGLPSGLEAGRGGWSR